MFGVGIFEILLLVLSLAAVALFLVLLRRR